MFKFTWSLAPNFLFVITHFRWWRLSVFFLTRTIFSCIFGLVTGCQPLELIPVLMQVPKQAVVRIITEECYIYIALVGWLAFMDAAANNNQPVMNMGHFSAHDLFFAHKFSLCVLCVCYFVRHLSFVWCMHICAHTNTQTHTTNALCPVVRIWNVPVSYLLVLCGCEWALEANECVPAPSLSLCFYSLRFFCTFGSGPTVILQSQVLFW